MPPMAGGGTALPAAVHTNKWRGRAVGVRPSGRQACRFPSPAGRGGQFPVEV